MTPDGTWPPWPRAGPLHQTPRPDIRAAYHGDVAVSEVPPTLTAAAVGPERRRRVGRWPFGVLVVAVLRLLDAFTLAAIGLGISGIPIIGLPVVVENVALTRSIDLTVAILTVAGVFGLLSFKRWGWVLTMVLVGMELLAELILVAMGQPDHLGLALLVVTAFYLNGSAIRALAGASVEARPPAQP
jgi:hypothetical protein